MSYLENKIRDVEEITSAGESAPFPAFYIYAVPKSDSAPSSVVVQGGLSAVKGETKTAPLTVMMWNPVVFNKIIITESDLAIYRFFAGVEG